MVVVVGAVVVVVVEVVMVVVVVVGLVDWNGSSEGNRKLPLRIEPTEEIVATEDEMAPLDEVVFVRSLPSWPTAPMGWTTSRPASLSSSSSSSTRERLSVGKTIKGFEIAEISSGDSWCSDTGDVGTTPSPPTANLVRPASLASVLPTNGVLETCGRSSIRSGLIISSFSESSTLISVVVFVGFRASSSWTRVTVFGSSVGVPKSHICVFGWVSGFSKVTGSNFGLSG